MNYYTPSPHALNPALCDMLRDHLGDTFREPELQLSETQLLAYNAFVSGRSILVLGKAGTGKSELIRYIRSKVDASKTLFVTSTTGISAYNIGGVTINSLLGIGTGKLPLPGLLRRVRSKRGIYKRIQGIDILIVDEISMMSAEVFEKIDALLRKIRGVDIFFGGIQVVLSGDFLQLPPVFKDDEADTRLIVESEIFKKMFRDVTYELQTNFRQSQDPLYSDVLSRIRVGKHTERDVSVIKARLDRRPETAIPVLVSSNRKAYAINTQNLGDIPMPEHRFNAEYQCYGDAELSKILKADLAFQMEQKGMTDLRLRRGCRVMLVKNINVQVGLVNGSVGTVLELYTDSVKCRFDNGYTETITRVEFEIDAVSAKVMCSQIPLTLAYSITIHKSQSLSLEAAVLDLSDCFCESQVYVAMSRVKTLNGVYLKSFDPKRIRVNEKILKFLYGK